MLDKVDALLQRVQLHQCAHRFLATIEYDINSLLRQLLSFYGRRVRLVLVLLQVELCDERLDIKFGSLIFQFFFRKWQRAIEG